MGTERKRIAAGLAALGLCASCGSDAPDAPGKPSAPAPTALEVVSGETMQPLAGARVIAAGAEYVTGPDGRITAAEPLHPGALVDVVAPGFLDRQTLLATAQSGRYTVWPRETATRLTEHATAEIVYTTSAIGRGAS